MYSSKRGLVHVLCRLWAETVGFVFDKHVLAAIMGNPVPRQERSVPWCFRVAGRLINFVSFLTMSCFIFAIFSLVPKFKPGITWSETLYEKQCLFHSRTCHAYYTKPKPTLVTFRQNAHKRKRKFQLISILDLAFGGRGLDCCISVKIVRYPMSTLILQRGSR